MGVTIRRLKGTRRASRLGNISRYGVWTGLSFPRGWQHTQAVLLIKAVAVVGVIGIGFVVGVVARTVFGRWLP